MPARGALRWGRCSREHLPRNCQSATVSHVARRVRNSVISKSWPLAHLVIRWRDHDWIPGLSSVPLIVPGRSPAARPFPGNGTTHSVTCSSAPWLMNPTTPKPHIEQAL